MELAAREHIENIRKNKFLIDQNVSNPLTEDLHNAVINLSAELYTKDNAEDNEYGEGVEPTLEFILTYRDICGLGVPATLLVFNNEIGFSKVNIESICSIGRSTKKCQRQKGFIGEKGIGFKSVFLVSSQPHIWSNGYHIKFNENPSQECGMGYIVPEWITSKPYICDIHKVYGFDKILPNTTIILPLKHEKLAVVKKHISKIHPELLLFLQKIKRLEVREKTRDSLSDSISAISISSEVNLVSLQNEGADSRIVHLAVQEKLYMPLATCRYFIYREVFPVNYKNMVETRKNVDEYTISLAFPFGDRLSRGSSSVGVFAFLPTAMVTNFPFIIQADFILSSSRETILLNNKWNLGILDQVPSCFVTALMTCFESPQMVKLFTIPSVLEFLPLKESPLKQWNVMRESIQRMVKSKCIIPCESIWSEDMVLRKPTEVVRNSLKFKKILSSIKDLIFPANGNASQEMFFLHNSLDDKKYDTIWAFLGVPSVADSLEKHMEFIRKKDIVFRCSKQVYADILFFISSFWTYEYKLPQTLTYMHLFEYNTGHLGREKKKTCNLKALKKRKKLKRGGIQVCYVDQVQQHFWLKKCNLAMGCPDEKYFLSDFIVAAITAHTNKESIMFWLRYKAQVLEISVSSYCDQLCHFVKERKDPNQAVFLAHIVYHSTLKFPSDMKNVSNTLKFMPVVERSGSVRLCETALVPSSKSKWVKLFRYTNLINGDNEKENDENEEEEYYTDFYVDSEEEYTRSSEFAGECIPEDELLKFLVQHGKAIDLFDIIPPDVKLPIASCQMESYQALLLLEWIKSLRAKYKIPDMFIESIKHGQWMKTYSGFSSSICCYLDDGIKSSTLLDLGKAFEVVSAIDEDYYEGKIILFRDELMYIGVQFGTNNIYELVVDQVKAHVFSSSEISAQLGISMLSFIRYSSNNDKLDIELLGTLKASKWVKTNKGYVSPLEAVYLLPGTREAILEITDLYVVDNGYYGRQLSNFVHELKLLGVKVNIVDVYHLIPNHFKFPENLPRLTKEAVFLLLMCIRKLGSRATSLKQKIITLPWINTTLGLKCPSESLFLDPKWSCISNVVPLPVIDMTYYGIQIKKYTAELEAIGVAVNLDQACNMLIQKVKVLVSSCDLNTEAVYFLLDFMKKLKTKFPLELPPLFNYLSEEKWLKTCHGYKSAPDCILPDSKWRSVSMFVDLLFIDELFMEIKYLRSRRN